jgi:hemin uptake protein HemP
MKKISKEKSALQQITDITSENLFKSQQELKHSQEHCGQLYAHTRELQSEVRFFLNLKIFLQVDFFSQVEKL